MTTIIRWNPLRELAAMQSAVDRVFNDAWRRNWRAWNELAEDEQADANWLPLDVFETDQGYTLVASLPGVDADRIDVKLHDDVLTIQAEIPQPASENATALLQERVYGKFSRRVRLPQPINFGAVEASYHDGVLTLALPKSEEAQPRVIQVKASGNGKK